MPSYSLAMWTTDRLPRLALIDAQCVAAEAAASAALALSAGSANVIEAAKYAEECLRGYVMHVSAHFQGFCRDLYGECAQLCIAIVPPSLLPAAQMQFFAQLALDRANPSHETIVRDFRRFSGTIDFAAPSVPGYAANARRITDLGHLQAWRNRVVHHGTGPLGSGVPAQLSTGLIRTWRDACDGLAVSLDAMMYNRLNVLLTAQPWTP